MQSTNIDLVVMATHGRRGVARWLLGSVAEEVVRCSSVPVVTVSKGGSIASSTDILVPVDLGETSRSTLAAALEVARATKSRVELLHVVEPPTSHTLIEGFPESPIVPLTELVAAAEGRIEDLVSEISLGDVKLSSRVLSGKAADTIIERAKHGEFGLIVQGTHARGGIERFFLGSVAQRVLGRAHCPVLTIKAQPATLETQAAAQPTAAVAAS